MKGKFIVIEGIDGSGKSTQAKQLVSKFKNKIPEIPFEYEFEPTYGQIGSEIRYDFLSGKEKVDNDALSYLFKADRVDHLKKANGILDQLEDGCNIICDRFVLSGIAYDIANKLMDMPKDGLSSKELDDIIIGHAQVIKGLIKPDLTIYIQTPAEEAYRRIITRSKKNGEKIEINESPEKLIVAEQAYNFAINAINRSFKHIFGDIVVINSIDPDTGCPYSKSDLTMKIFDVINIYFPDIKNSKEMSIKNDIINYLRNNLSKPLDDDVIQLMADTVIKISGLEEKGVEY